jgi:hypothetical protein
MNRSTEHAPGQIVIEAGGELSCPWHGRVEAERCGSCPFLQGMLDGPDRILCGFGHGAPLRRRTETAHGVPSEVGQP